METKAAIIHYCRYQERCHAEVKNKLYELGCHTTMVNDLIATMVEMDLLNEERFAKAFARGKFRMKQWGREKIKQELRLKKVSDYCIKKGMKEIDGDEYDKILNKLADKKCIDIQKDRSMASKKMKLYRYLIQKGYERDIVMDQVKKRFDK